MTATGYCLEELRAALRHLNTNTHGGPFVTNWGWLDSSSVVVVGVSGGIGTSTVALAVAEALGADRLVELCPSWLSGLVEATTAELGTDQGWQLGTRGDLLIERREDRTAAVREIPGQVVVDAGASTGSDWPQTGAALVVVVAPCTIPGVRRLSNLMSLPPTRGHVVAALTGATTLKALPRAMTAATSPRVEAMIRDGELVMVPACSALRRAGITGDPLPKPLRAAATALAHSLKEALP